MHAPMQPH
ncbi:hypothetical protein TGPRC2_227995A, partial [Toxoplasma gondii TgCatPRC2]